MKVKGFAITTIMIGIVFGQVSGAGVLIGYSSPFAFPRESETVAITKGRPSRAGYSLNCIHNPFNPVAAISYSLPKTAGEGRIVIRDIRGAEVAQYRVEPGSRSLNFNAGKKGDIPSGVYFITLEQAHSGKIHKKAKALLVK